MPLSILVGLNEELFLEGLGVAGMDSWGEERKEGCIGMGAPMWEGKQAWTEEKEMLVPEMAVKE